MAAAKRRQLRSMPGSWTSLRMHNAGGPSRHAALCMLRKPRCGSVPMHSAAAAAHTTQHTGCLTAPAAQGPLLPPHKSSCPPQCRPAAQAHGSVGACLSKGGKYAPTHTSGGADRLVIQHASGTGLQRMAAQPSIPWQSLPTGLTCMGTLLPANAMSRRHCGPR